MHSAPARGVPTRVLIVCFVSSQREDLEFSVGSKAAVWEVKDPLLAGSYTDEDASSNYHAPSQQYGYGGGAPSLVGGVSGVSDELPGRTLLGG